MAGSKGILITICGTKGSTPRNRGAWIWVGSSRILGSIGGGQMEADAIEYARKMRANGEKSARHQITLGPEIAQCCGGQVELQFEESEPPEPNPPHLAIFGAGHVGSVLAPMAAAVPFEVSLFDNRERIELERPAAFQHSPRPELEIDALQAQSHVIILTHDHALDFRIAERALLRDDLGFIGMIGSKSKAAGFRSQFAALGTRLERLHSPIAKNSNDKRPASIALDILREILGQDAT